MSVNNPREVRAGTLLLVSHACSRAVNRDAYAAMLDLGWRVVVVTVDALQIGAERLASDPPEHPGLELHFLPQRGSHARIQTLPGLGQIIAATRPDWVVLDNDAHSLQALLLALSKRRLGFRFAILSCENLDFSLRALWRRRGWRGAVLGLAGLLLRQIVRPRTDLLFSINHAGVDLFRNAGFRWVEWTPLGYPERYFHIDAQARERIRAKYQLHSPVIAYFGRLAPEKGVHLLLDALDAMLDRDWHLMIDDFQADDLYRRNIDARLQQCAWKERVSRVHARHGEVADYMNAADIVVIPSIATPSWVEQYGRVLPEALACGCEVVCANTGQLPKFLPDATQRFAQGSASELRDCLKTLLSDSGLLRRARLARGAEQYSAHAHSVRWNAVLAGGDLGS